MGKRKKKIPKVQIIRRVMQIASFLLLPALFVSTYIAIKSVYLAIINQTFAVETLLPQLILLLAVVPLTILLGRFFCGFLCSFGAMADFFWFLGRKMKLKPLKISEKLDKSLRLVKYGILLFILIFIWTLGWVQIESTSNPWDMFGMFTSFSALPSASYVLTIGFGLLFLIIIGSFFVERFFCRYLCPLGAVFSFLSRPRILKLKKPTENCGSCKACTKSCTMGLPLYRSDTVNSGECIQCMACISACPRENITARIGKSDVAPLATGLAATAMMLGIYYVGNIATSNVQGADYSSMVDQAHIAEAEGLYTDGVYEGTATGYRGTTTVAVTVESGLLTDVEVISTDDDMEFFSQAANTIIPAILCSQCADVDAVSGATFSSNGLIDAIALALTEAGGEEMTTEMSEPQATVEEEIISAPTEDSVALETGAYEDGTYTGTGTGYENGETTLRVLVEDGRISAIDIISYEDDDPYFRTAFDGVTSAIIETQAVEVDAVSGATFSSNGIMEAVADALDLDFTNSNSELQSEKRGKGHK